MRPEVKILAISNVYCRLMNFKKKGDVELGHFHDYNHGTLLSTGKLKVEMISDDNLTPAVSDIFKDKGLNIGSIAYLIKPPVVKDNNNV